ncbi:MAG TPA: threonine/serine dehydratase [Candidatus Saccharimonadales bacterium]|nr:threonine/serine dehydratase [Candidatus Saccharimonadales bacterium]
MVEQTGRAVLAAHERIRNSITETPLEQVSGPGIPPLVRLLFKREDLQETGSFKLRGATNRIMELTPGERAMGIIAASNGNHGRGVAAAARKIGVPAEVYVSSYASTSKIQKIEEYGAIVRRVGDDPLDAEIAARSAATAAGKTYISPYNDPEVIAGQGTIAVELLRQQPGIDAVFVAVGGGGLIGGIGAYLKWVSPKTEVVGCWPENSRVLLESIKAGKIIDVPEQPTLSESTAGGLEPGSITLDICKGVIDSSVLVTEEEILAAMCGLQKSKDLLIEGAAAVALAAFHKQARHYEGKTVVVVICGGNISPEVRSRVERAVG